MDQKVVSLVDFRAKKKVEETLSPDRNPLYVSHLSEGKLQGSPYFRRPKSSDFGDRLSRVKNSLERIQKLMDAMGRQEK